MHIPFLSLSIPYLPTLSWSTPEIALTENIPPCCLTWRRNIHSGVSYLLYTISQSDVEDTVEFPQHEGN